MTINPSPNDLNPKSTVSNEPQDTNHIENKVLANLLSQYKHHFPEALQTDLESLKDRSTFTAEALGKIEEALEKEIIIAANEEKKVI